MLKDRRNAAAPGADIGERRRRLAIKPNLTAIRGQQAAEDRNECRFAGAVTANESEASAWPKAGIDSSQGVCAAEPFTYPDRLEGRRCVLGDPW